MAKTTTKTATPAKTKNGKARTGKGRQGADDIIVDVQTKLQHANDELRAKVQALEAAAGQVKAALENDNEALRAKVADLQKAGQPQLAILIVPKPKGSSYSLQKKMGLDDDLAKYDEIKTVWKKLIRIAVFEDGVTFANQPKEKIVKYAKRARATIPFLRRFRADWATEAYLRRSLRNRKGHLRRKAAAAIADIEVTLDDGPDSVDDEKGDSSEMDDE